MGLVSISVLFLAVLAAPVASQQQPRVKIGSEAPELADGAWLHPAPPDFPDDPPPTRLAEMRGKVVLVYFFASWSDYSIDYMETLSDQWEDHRDQGLMVLAISDEGLGTVQRMLRDKELDLPICAASETRESYGATFLPAGFMLDHAGIVAWKGDPTDGSWLEALPQELRRARSAREAWEPGPRDPILAEASEMARNKDMGGAWKTIEQLERTHADDAEKLPLIRAFKEDFLAMAQERRRVAGRYENRGCLFLAYQFLENQKEIFENTPLEEEWKIQLREWRRQRDTKKLLKLDEQRLEALRIIKETGNVGKGLKQLKEILEEARGTPLEKTVAEDVEKAI